MESQIFKQTHLSILTDENRITEFAKFGESEYTIKETKGLDGYEESDDAITVKNDGTWDNETAETAEVVNVKIPTLVFGCL